MAIDLYGYKPPRPGDKIFVVDETFIGHSGISYQIGDRIAPGAHGVVHRCMSEKDGLDYAIKFLIDHREKSLKRFQKEQLIHRELQHEHLISYHEHGEIDGIERRSSRRRRVDKDIKIPYILMDVADESLLDSIRDKAGSFEFELYASQFRGLARGLAVLHKLAIHRDIKPSNILIAGEKWVISDYGLCKSNDATEEDDLTPGNEVVGPRFWMSPEANNRNVGVDDEITPASDVFQLASIFWLIVNKRHPTGVVRKEDWIGPEKLFDPIYYALHNDPALRPKDGSEFADALDAAILT